MQRLQQNLLSKHLHSSARPWHIAMESYNQSPRQCQQQQEQQQEQHQEQQQQQQQQQQQEEAGMGSPGSPSPALTFGGLSFDECRSVFLSPNACRPTAASLLPAWAPAAASNAAPVFSPAAATTAATTAATIAAIVSAARRMQLPKALMTNAPHFANAALLSTAAAACDAAAVMKGASFTGSGAFGLPLKRAREAWSGLLGNLPLHGGAEDGCADQAIGHSEAWDERCVRQGREMSWQQRLLWPQVLSETGHLDGLLMQEHRQLEEHRQIEGKRRRVVSPCSDFAASAATSAALSAPLHNQIPALAGSFPGGMSNCRGRSSLTNASIGGPELAPSTDTCNGGHDSDPHFSTRLCLTCCRLGVAPLVRAPVYPWQVSFRDGR
ncbi:hypothetical protein CLOM_g23809 [Closterium sp. NIES-68]|nr:hypothetical protein CLOM_g23809 [Closterium sp. NIES-68]GJP76062.1 hypothetical protein CLOP_g6450 [Closterium sp. NIES-67]